MKFCAPDLSSFAPFATVISGVSAVSAVSAGTSTVMVLAVSSMVPTAPFTTKRVMAADHTPCSPSYIIFAMAV